MVSVIVPVFNNETFVRQCVDSICRQTISDIEVILVDDGSTDDSGRICDGMAMEDSRVRVVHTPNRGVSAARNLGVEIACGDYIMFVDSDDTIHHAMIETLMALLRKYSAGCAVCAFTHSPAKLSVKGRTTVHSVRKAVEKTLYQSGMDSSLCCKLFPAGAVRRAKLREGLRYEDLDSIYRIYENIDGLVVSTTAPMYLYRRNLSSFIHNFTNDRLDVLKVTEAIVAHYKNDALMLPAARDRRFSANFNMFILATRAAHEADASRCWGVIKEGRREALRNPQVRIKNKVGAVVSYLGKDILQAAIRILTPRVPCRSTPGTGRASE